MNENHQPMSRIEAMSEKKVTVVISPRDRFSGIVECIEGVYQHTDPQLFDLIGIN